MTDDRPSPEQAEWVALARAVRRRLRRYAANIPAMEPDEVAAFVTACRDAMWFELTARAFDVKAAKEELPWE